VVNEMKIDYHFTRCRSNSSEAWPEDEHDVCSVLSQSILCHLNLSVWPVNPNLQAGS
jgi:hypothetical protein